MTPLGFLCNLAVLHSCNLNSYSPCTGKTARGSCNVRTTLVVIYSAPSPPSTSISFFSSRKRERGIKRTSDLGIGGAHHFFLSHAHTIGTTLAATDNRESPLVRVDRGCDNGAHDGVRVHVQLSALRNQQTLCGSTSPSPVETCRRGSVMREVGWPRRRTGRISWKVIPASARSSAC